ncbi:MAG TPA: flagellar hook-length control protein FliK [Polyangiaceae bacterium]
MMHIMSLIRESLGTSETPAKTQQTTTHGAAALKVDHEETFHEILSHMPSSPAPAHHAASAARVKAHSITAKKSSHDDDEGDEDENTTCVTPDDFLAWAFNAQSATQTMPVPGLGNTDEEPVDPTAATVLSMNAVQLDARGAKALGDSVLPDTIGQAAPPPSSTPVGANMASFLEPPSGESTDASDDAEGPTTDRVSLTQLARSKSATEVPPPSVLPNVEADLSIETTRQTPIAKTMRPVAETTAASVAQNAPTPKMSAEHAFELTTRWNRNAGPQGRTSTMLSMPAVRGPAPQQRPQPTTTSSDTQTDMAAVHPESDPSFRLAAEAYAPLASLGNPSLQAAAPSVRVPRTDYAVTEARQQAAIFAVNQMTLRRVVADGELDIPELGKVRVDAQTKNGEVDVKITADREETRSLVNEHAHAIALDARTAAIPVANVKIDGALQNGGANASFSGSNGGAKEEPKQHDFEDKTREQTPDAKRGATKARFVL